MKLTMPFYLATLGLAPYVCLAQQPALSSVMVARHSATTTSTSVSIVSGAAKVRPETTKPLTSRWLALDTLSHTERYRNAFESGGYHVFDNAQQRSLIVGKIKLDAQGRYDIGFRASSGRCFNWAYGSYTGKAFIPRVTSAAALAAYLTPADKP